MKTAGKEWRRGKDKKFTVPTDNAEYIAEYIFNYLQNFNINKQIGICEEKNEEIYFAFLA